MTRRVPAGVPTGGQFAPSRMAESQLSLEDDFDFVLPFDDASSSELPTPVAPEPKPEPAPEADPAPPPTPEPAVNTWKDLISRARAQVSECGATAESELAVTAAGKAIAEEIDRRVEAGRNGFAIMRSDVTRDVLAEVRPLGGVDLIYTETSGPASAAANRLAQIFPTEWLERSNGLRNPVKVRYSGSRAHYVPQKTLLVKEDRQIECELVSCSPPPDAANVRPDPLRSGAWRYTAKRKVRTVIGSRTFAEVTMPNPKGAPKSAMRTGTHELTHRMEDAMPRIGELEAAFKARRCGLPGQRRVVAAFEGSRKEVALDGGFVVPYVGKQYYGAAGRFHEVMSTGMEAVIGGKYGGLVGEDGHKADPDHRAFVLGVLACV